MSQKDQSDSLLFFPFKKEFLGYSWRDLIADCNAGLTVSLLTIPQAMAFALVAGLPLTTGFFAAIFSCIFAAFFCQTRHLIIGPSNSIAILVQAGIAEVLFTYFRDVTGPEREMIALQILTLLVFLVGFMQLLVSLFRLGRFTQFVSHSVVMGYIAGAAFAMMISQLYVFSGIASGGGVHSYFYKAFYFFTHLNEVHWATILVGMLGLGILVKLKSWSPKIPASLIAFIATSGILYGFSQISFDWGFFNYFQERMQQVALVGDTADFGGFAPVFTLPFFQPAIFNHLLPMAFAIALLGILETVIVSKAVAAHSGEQLNINQDLLGLGLGNFAGSFVMALPISGSTSRSILNYKCGAKSRLSTFLGVGFVTLVLFWLSPLVSKIPLAALAAMMIVTAVNVINKKQLLLSLKATTADSWVFWMTFLACVFLSLDTAFYIGIVLSIALYLKKAAVPRVAEYAVDEEGHLVSSDYYGEAEHRPIRLIKVEGELFFGASDLFQSALTTLADGDSETKVILLQLKNARDMDATTCLALMQLNRFLQRSGRHLILCGITLPIWEVLSNSGLVEEIGKENLFLFDPKHPYTYLKKAHQRAQFLIAQEVKEQANFELLELEEVKATSQ